MARCIHRAGDEYTNPASPVYPGECGAVCGGDVFYKVRVVS
jgi:hypothetical protein